MPTDKIIDLLSEDHSRYSPLQRLLKTSSNQKQWTRELQACLEQPLCNEVQVTDIKGKIAFILCNSSAAATRLRFLLPKLQTTLNSLASFNRVTEFKIRVAYIED